MQLTETGGVECVRYDPGPLPDGHVRIRTVRSAISSGTEMTFYGKAATNVYLHKRWNEELRLFEPGPHRWNTAGDRIPCRRRSDESRAPGVAVGTRVYGNWRHTEFTSFPARSPRPSGCRMGWAGMTAWTSRRWTDLPQRHDVCRRRSAGGPAVVFGAGAVGLMTAQMVRATGADAVIVVDRVPARLESRPRSASNRLMHDAGDVAASIKRRHGRGRRRGLGVHGFDARPQRGDPCRPTPGAVIAGASTRASHGLVLGDEFHHNGVRVICGQIGNVHPGQTWRTLRPGTIGMGLSGQVALGDLPRLTVPIEEAARGFAALRALGRCSRWH